MISRKFLRPLKLARNGFFMERANFVKVCEIHTSCIFSIKVKPEEKPSKSLVIPFESAKQKQKESFMECIRQYESRRDPKHDHLQFIKVAMKYMDQFGVNKDLEAYKAILNVFPKGKLVPRNPMQVIFLHYPKDQFTATDLLEKMEDNAVIPDPEVQVILKNVFGTFGHPCMKLYAMQYWFPKFKNLTPWPVPKPLPNDTLELAKLVIQRITSVDLRTKVSVYDSENVKESIDKTWIVSGISPRQGELLKKHNNKEAIFVEGPFITWLGNKCLEYFILRAKPPAQGYQYPDESNEDDVTNIRIPQLEHDFTSIILPPSVHETEEGIIFSVCATGTSTKDSLLSWIRCLGEEHPVLENIPILFKLKSHSEEKLYVEDKDVNKMEQLGETKDKAD